MDWSPSGELQRCATHSPWHPSVWPLFPVKIARSFSLKILLMVAVRRWSSAVSSVLVEEVVSVVEVLLAPRVVLAGEFCEKVTLVRVGVWNFDDFPRGIFGSVDFKFDFEYLLLRDLWEDKWVGIGCLVFIYGIFSSRALFEYSVVICWFGVNHGAHWA